MCLFSTGPLNYKLNYLQVDNLQGTESSKYYARPQTAVARGLDLPTRPVSEPSDCRCFQTLTVLFQFIFRVDGHAQRRTFAKRKH